MKIVLAGMKPQDTAAMEVLVAKATAGWNCQSVTALEDVAPSGADLCVLDLAGLGIHRFSEPTGARLLDSLGDLPGILLTRQNDVDWSGWRSGVADPSQLMCLQKPIQAQTVREALEQISKKAAQRHAERTKPSMPPGPPAQPAQAAAATSPAAPKASKPPTAAQPIATALTTSAMPPPSAAGAANGEAAQLRAQNFRVQIDALDGSRPRLFLSKVADALATQKPFEVRLTPQHGLLVAPHEGWVASNTPGAVIHSLVRSDALAAAVHIHEVPGDARQHMDKDTPMSVQPLDAFLWNLLNHI